MEITFNIANICNLKCDYCIFVGKGSGKKIENAIILGLNKILDYYLSENQRVSLTFSGGGEPFLFFDDIQQIVSGIDVRNRHLLDIYIITNGTIYSQKISQFVKSNNIFLVLSLDGVKESHDINRRFVNGNSSFEEIQKNQHILFQDVVDVNYTIYHNNFKKLLLGVEYIKKNFPNLRRLNFNFVFNTPLRTVKKLIELQRVFDNFLDIYIQKQWFRNFETNLRNFGYLGGLEYEDSCLGHLYINRDGNVFKCGAYEFNFAGKPIGTLNSVEGDEVDFYRKNTKNCASKCSQAHFSTVNKQLSKILYYIGKKYAVVDYYIDNTKRKYNY